MSALIFWLSAGLATVLTLLSASWYIVERKAQDAHWVNQASEATDVVLWLGCPVATLAFQARANALQELIAAGNVSRVILSGTSDEVTACRQALSPTSDVELIEDAKGYRTRASLLNVRKERIESQITVVSHRYHLVRVAYLAESIGLRVRLYSTGTPLKSWMSRGRWRELFARTRAVLDHHFPNEQPDNHIRKQS